MFKNTPDVKSKKVATIMGTPGIGKTVFGLFMIHELLKEGKSVVYYHGGENKYFLFGPQDSSIFEAARQHGYCIPASTKTCYVGRITTDSDHTRVDGLQLVGFLVGLSDLYYVHDPPKTGISLRVGICCKRIISSSPHRAEANTMDKFDHKFYLPMWSKEELGIANKRFQLCISPVELEERWKIFGGSARWVLATNRSVGVARLDEACAKLSNENMVNLMDPCRNAQGKISSLVVHMHPNNNLIRYSTRISTSKMFSEICSRLQLSTNAAVQQWASTLDRGTHISVGLIMEQCWHNQIIFGSGVVGGALWELRTNRSASGKKGVLRSIPKFEGSVSFVKNDMSDLQSLLENHYCVPDQTNFPTVDSFAALRHPFCDLKNNELCLVGIQMTTGE